MPLRELVYARDVVDSLGDILQRGLGEVRPKRVAVVADTRTWRISYEKAQRALEGPGSAPCGGYGETFHHIVKLKFAHRSGSPPLSTRRIIPSLGSGATILNEPKNLWAAARVLSVSSGSSTAKP